MAKQIDEDLTRRLNEMRDQISEKTKELVKKVDAWRYFIHWASSYAEPVVPGIGDADILLNKQQCSEFAFSYNPKIYPETFILFAQPSNYDWLKSIGIKCFILERDGVVVVIDEVDTYGIYIASKSFKITISENMMEKMQQAKQNAKFARIASINYKYNINSDRTDWSIDELAPYAFPIVDNFLASKRL